MTRVREVTVRITAEIEADGITRARRIVVIDGETGERVQVWPKARRPVLSVPAMRIDSPEPHRMPVAGERVFLRG